MRPPLRHWWIALLRHLLIVTVVGLLVSGLMIAIFRQPPALTLLYCFCVSLGCSTLIRGLAVVFAGVRLALLRRAGHDTNHASLQWPGWPLMIVAIVLGTVLGYSLGVELGNWISGRQERGLMNTSAQHAMAAMAISLIPGFGLTYFFLSRSRIADAQARAAAAQTHAETARRQAAETQLRLLQSQLEPHMLFNTLANLRVLIGLDAARAQVMLDHLIAFLRATLAASRSDRHALRDEFDRLADYLALMQVRMGSRLRFTLDLPPALAAMPVPPLLLQPLVENAIKHGLEPHVAGGQVTVRASTQHGRLVLTVEDDGRGLIDAAAPDPQGGFGTLQVKERLAVAYGPAAQFALAPRPGGGTVARIDLPGEAASTTDRAPLSVFESQGTDDAHRPDR